MRRYPCLALLLFLPVMALLVTIYRTCFAPVPALFPAAANWHYLVPGTAHLLLSRPEQREAYLLSETEPEQVWHLTWAGGSFATQPVEPEPHPLTLTIAIPAFGVQSDTLPLRSLPGPDGRFYYLKPEGVPRELVRSPDGRTLALTDRGHNAVWLCPTDRLLPTQATRYRGDGFDKQASLAASRTQTTEGWSLIWAAHPLWSPDGEKLLYLSSRDGQGGTDLWALFLSSGREKLLLRHGDGSFLDLLGWTKEGQLLLLDGNGTIFRLAQSDTKAEILLTLAHPVSLSLDGDCLVYQKINPQSRVVKPELAGIDPDTGAKLILPSIPPPYRVNVSGSWSPDNTCFAFFAYSAANPGQTALAVLRVAPEPRLEYWIGPPSPGLSFNVAAEPGWLDSTSLICPLIEQTAPDATWLVRLGGGPP